MKTVTDQFTFQQLRSGNVGVQRVYYKRRYWNEATRLFAWEGSWTELERSAISSVSSVNWQLDSEQLNEFKVSNVTLTLDNSDNRWNPDNPVGFFKSDATSRRYFYEPYWTKFQLRSGYVLSDGTEELVTLFTGVATEYIMDSGDKVVQVTVSGLEALLLNTKAESIATVVTEELPTGTINGVNTIFTTLNPGVGGITLVSVNGITKVEGSDYTVSQLSSSTLGAKVTFTSAPNGGEVVRVSYFYWPQSQTFHAVVASLLTAAGISAGNQSISPVVFANSVITTQTYTSQADWDGGTKAYLETVTVPGSMKMDWPNITQLTTWSQSLTGWSQAVATWTTDGTWLKHPTGASNPLLTRPDTSAVGSWGFTYKLDVHTASCRLDFMFMATSTSNRQYWITIDMNHPVTGTTDIYLRDAGFTVRASRLGLPVTGTSEHTMKITRYPSGRIVVVYDGSTVIDYVDTQYTSGSYMWFFYEVNSNPIRIKDIYYPIQSIEGRWTGPIVDLTSTPDAWGVYEYSEVTAGATTLYETRTSANGIAFDAYATVSAQGTPQSTLRRYVQTRVTITFTAAQNFDPVIQSIVLRTTASSANITLPAFTGSNVYEAVQKIGEFTLYEFGFTPDEVFFFRARTSGASVLSMNQADLISKIYAMDSGYERMYGIVTATYGSITKQVTDDGAWRFSPSSRTSQKRYEISPDSAIQVPSTADFATGVAAQIFKLLSKRRRRLKVVTKFLPQLDLSDTVTVTLDNNFGPTDWCLGDSTVYLGQENTFLHGDSEQFVSGMACKVVAARYDTRGWQSEFELEEIPT